MIDEKNAVHKLSWSPVDKPLPPRPFDEKIMSLYEMVGGDLGIYPAERELERERAEIDEDMSLLLGLQQQ